MKVDANQYFLANLHFEKLKIMTNFQSFFTGKTFCSQRKMNNNFQNFLTIHSQLSPPISHINLTKNLSQTLPTLKFIIWKKTQCSYRGSVVSILFYVQEGGCMSCLHQSFSSILAATEENSACAPFASLEASRLPWQRDMAEESSQRILRPWKEQLRRQRSALRGWPPRHGIFREALRLEGLSHYETMKWKNQESMYAWGRHMRKNDRNPFYQKTIVYVK